MTGDRVFLDANILFSAAYRPEAGIARLCKIKGIELVTSHYAAEEARLNLAKDDERRRLTGLLERLQIIISVSPRPLGVQLPHKDMPILQAAIYARATYLLTGDKQHFGRYFGHRLAGILVLPPAEYLRDYSF